MDGEGWLPVAQLKHLMCTNFGKASGEHINTQYFLRFHYILGPESETLNEEEFDFLISHIKKTDQDFIQYKDFANILSKKYLSI